MTKVYLIDGADYVELDSDELDFMTTYGVAEISDLGKRTDNISKTVTFKNTKVNDNAFGNLFNQNRITDTSIPNKLFFNYNPLIPVDCLVFEDNVLILKGTMRVIKINSNGFYETVITGKFIEFMKTIQEKYLTDLDLTDLSHRYLPNVIANSWMEKQERMTFSGSFYNYNAGATAVPDFISGKGYIYPFIDYGFTNSGTASFVVSGVGANARRKPDYSKFNVLNFKPAVPVREIFDRIFSQPGLTGYSYEVKGDSGFINRFNSLIVPNNQERITVTKSGFSEHFSSGAVSIFTVADVNTYYQGSGGAGVRNPIFERGIKLPNFEFLPTGTFNKFIDYDRTTLGAFTSYRGLTAAVLYVNRTITASGQFNVELRDLINISGVFQPVPITIKIQLVERDYIAPTAPNFSDTYSWQSTPIAESAPLNLPRGVTISSFNFNVSFEDRVFNEGKQLLLRIFAEGGDIGQNYVLQLVRYNIGSANLYVPKDQFSSFLQAASIDLSNPDVIPPILPINVKQFDFVKSIINHLNLYVYSDYDNPKKLIFQKYDDYYVYTDPVYLATNSLNWTSKIEYKSVNMDSNLTIPKTYTFTYKDDNDYYNEFIKKKYDRPYGTFKFTDSLGITNERKVELIFSPTPLNMYDNTGRLVPGIFKVDSNNNTQLLKSNIRLLYYNKYTNHYNDTNVVPWKALLNNVNNVTDVNFGTGWGITQSGYPMCTHYFCEYDTLTTNKVFGSSASFVTGQLFGVTLSNILLTGQYPELVGGQLITVSGTNFNDGTYTITYPYVFTNNTTSVFVEPLTLVNERITATFSVQINGAYKYQTVDDLNFGIPDELIFTPDAYVLNAVSSYENYYLNQTTELTNVNLNTIDCDAYLNELDIENLDLRTPIFIDLGEGGNGYFKVLSVEYSDRKYKSRLKLQKIV